MPKKILPTLLSVLFLATTWQFIALGIGYPAIFPTLDKLLTELLLTSISSHFWAEMGTTILRGTIGFGLAVVLACCLATLAAFSAFWNRFLHPIVILGRSLPVISLVLLALLWFSSDSLPVFIAVLTMFPILYQHILTGLQLTDIRLVQMAKLYGKTMPTIFRRIYLPSARHTIFGGFKTALGFGWRAVIMGEVLAQPLHGIGTAMKQAQTYINVPELIAWTVWAIAISYLFDALLRLVERHPFRRAVQPPTTMMQPTEPAQTPSVTIQMHELSKSFDGKRILDKCTYRFNQQQPCFLKGSSGIGKTTLLKIIGGIEKADHGTLTIGTDNTAMRNKLRKAFVFQDVRLLPWLTVSENILFTGIVLTADSPFLSPQSRLDFLLEKGGLTQHAHKYPHELSGGQQQRAGLLQALAIQPDILLLDEPLTGLDPDTKKEIVELIRYEITTFSPLTIWATHETVQLNGISTETIELQA